MLIIPIPKSVPKAAPNTTLNTIPTGFYYERVRLPTLVTRRPCKNAAKCSHMVDANSQKRYCSKRCQQQAYRARRKLREQAARAKVQATPQCRVCSERFVKKSSQHKCCSNKCRQKLYREQRDLKLKDRARQLREEMFREAVG